MGVPFWVYLLGCRTNGEKNALRSAFYDAVCERPVLYQPWRGLALIAWLLTFAVGNDGATSRTPRVGVESACVPAGPDL